MSFSRGTLLLDEELSRLKLGRYAGEEAEERQLWSRPSLQLRLPGLRQLLGPSIGTCLGLPALRSTRAALLGKAVPFTLNHRTVSKLGTGRTVGQKDRVYFALSPGEARAARLASGALQPTDGRLVGGALRWQKAAKAWYVERNSTTAAALARRFALAPELRRAPSPTAKPPGTAGAHQRYIERDGAAENVAGAVFSRGTIGEDTQERVAFWKAVEDRERADGRVQCRVVAELPHELSAAGRRRAVASFLEVFHERGLPAHAVIHRPDHARDPSSGGDPRNVHLHVVYHDRPARRTGRGRWLFAAKKDRAARGADWIRQLRQRYAACCNAELEAENLERRYHPGSYAEMGIDKTPQVHLGPVLAAFERQGRPTRKGAVNLICERAWERRVLLEEARAAAEAAGGFLGRLRAAPEPAGPEAAAACAAFGVRAVGFADAAASADPELVDAVLAARDRDGRRARAASLAAHAAKAAQRKRVAARDRTAWESVGRAARDFLAAYRPAAAATIDPRSLRRRAAETAVSERRFEDVQLLGRRSRLTGRLRSAVRGLPDRAALLADRSAAERTAERARRQAASARAELEAALAVCYVAPSIAAGLLIGAAEAGEDWPALLRSVPTRFGRLVQGAAPPPSEAVKPALERCLALERLGRDHSAQAATAGRAVRQDRLGQTAQTPSSQLDRRRRRALLRALDAVDLEISARPTALRLARRLGVGAEIERRAGSARRRQRAARER